MSSLPFSQKISYPPLIASFEILYPPLSKGGWNYGCLRLINQIDNYSKCKLPVNNAKQKFTNLLNFTYIQKEKFSTGSIRYKH